MRRDGRGFGSTERGCIVEQSLIIALIGVVAGALVMAAFVWLRAQRARKERDAANSGAARIIEEAKKDAAAIKKEAEVQAKDSVLKERAEFER